MADITQIRAKIETADVYEAGTDSWVYLGIAGREFLLDSGSGNDFEQGVNTCFVLGRQDKSDAHDHFTVVPVVKAEYNDPRKPQLDTDDLDHYPIYIRMEEQGSAPGWCVERVRVSVHGSGSEHHFDNLRLDTKAENRRIWLDRRYGQRIFLRRATAKV
ncbi:hypothetical protein ABZ615_11700 [Streptomyces sp. NPDC007325]|uniref:hypothetical protein n=1 Tax=Streptomyces sp. NPDC007325 TaxID=3154588 RepID=UPI0034013A0A